MDFVHSVRNPTAVLSIGIIVTVWWVMNTFYHQASGRERCHFRPLKPLLHADFGTLGSYGAFVTKSVNFIG